MFRFGPKGCYFVCLSVCGRKKSSDSRIKFRSFLIQNKPFNLALSFSMYCISPILGSQELVSKHSPTPKQNKTNFSTTFQVPKNDLNHINISIPRKGVRPIGSALREVFNKKHLFCHTRPKRETCRVGQRGIIISQPASNPTAYF